MNKSIIEIKALYEGFASIASSQSGQSYMIYTMHLSNLIANYCSYNAVSTEFIEFGEKHGYINDPDSEDDDEYNDGCCGCGVEYNCCPNGCEDTALAQRRIDSNFASLIISDERAFEIHIEFMASIGKIRCGVYDDMADILISNNILYNSKVLNKFLPCFSELWEGEFCSLAFNCDGDDIETFCSLKNQKVGFYESILKGIDWRDVYCYLRHRFATDWLKEAKSEIEIAFIESVVNAVNSQFNFYD